MPNPTKRHDPRLPNWGPFTKRYPGVSHIPDLKKGIRFDVGFLPGHYRRQVLVPNAKWESGHHPWEAAEDLSYYSYRYEVEWKDRVTVDVSVSTLNEQARLIRAEMVNRTTDDQNLALNLVAYLNFPPVKTYSDEPLQPVNVRLPEGAAWIDALDYEDLTFSVQRPTDNLVYDALLRAEIRRHGYVNGSAIGMGFGRDAGDSVLYHLTLAEPLPDAHLLLRYRAEGRVRFRLEGSLQTEIELTDESDTALLDIPLGDLPAGVHPLRLISLGGSGVEIDGFVLAPGAVMGRVRFTPHTYNPHPEILPGPRAQSLVLKYADIDTYYGLAWNWADAWVREIINDELDRFLRQMVHEHTQKVMVGPGKDGHFTNVYLRPFHLPPESAQVVHCLVCSGSLAEVETELARFPFKAEPLENVYHAARAQAVQITGAESGESYRFSQERMAANTLMNVVYPVYARRTYIRHFTPGKWWDCLYTWDSGFIGLGLLELSIERAVDSLDAYVTDPGDDQAAFVHHGSFVPVQMYLFKELWNRTQDRGLLEYFYPRLRQYYHFLAGRAGSSTTRSLQSNLLKTWDYFYNSGGWDDYPPQVHVHRHGLEKWVAPAVTTSHAIRSAKILRSAAQALGAVDDLRLYDEDIETFTQALQQVAWDEQAGYFSYVTHDNHGKPGEFLYYEQDGKKIANYNMGMDGASPLYAGVCTPAQEERLIANLFSPERMWTRIGLSTVDQSAPYYRNDGYWNGAVWMPHQWFFWKALLDLGHGDLAHQVAQTALDVWRDEVEKTYNCCEHFIVQSGRGAGWHQFSGLSTPVLAWYSAYHLPGRLTCGLDVWVEKSTFSDYNRIYQGRLRIQENGAKKAVVIVNMQPGPAYRVTWNDQPADFIEITPGVLQVTLSRSPEGTLVVK